MNNFYEFENFRVDAEKRLLLTNGESVSIKPKTFDTLLALIKSKNETLTKDDLILEIWNGDAVSDDSLTQQISQLRKILGETADTHNFIVTIPGIGYKFVADVRQIQSANINGNRLSKFSLPETEKKESDVSDSEGQNEIEEKSNENQKNSGYFQAINAKILLIACAAFLVISLTVAFIWNSYKTEPTTALGVKKIAVLPFRAVTQDAETESLRRGMTDTLVLRLSRIDEISILPSSVTSSFESSGQSPSEFGAKIGADAVLDGAIRKNDGQIIVNIQLIRTADGKVIWAESFQNEFTDILNVQSLIAYKIAQTLSLELSPEEERALMKRYTTSAEAYRLYLDARVLTSSRPTGEARIAAQRNFERAIALDPNFALAYVGLADLLVHEPNEENYRKMKYLARKALEIDPELGEAYEVLAFAVWRGDWNWQEAERLTRKSIELNRNYPSSYATLTMLLYGQGKFDEAFEAAENISENSTVKAGYKMSLYYYARQYEKAIDLGNKELARIPNDITLLSYLGPAYTESGQYEKAVNATDDYIAVDTLAYPGSLCYLGYTYAKAGQTMKAKEILQKILTAKVPQESQTHGGMAMLYGALGEKDAAFEHLEKSIENREWWAFTLKVAPYYDSLRDDPRFTEMLKKVNLAD